MRISISKQALMEAIQVVIGAVGAKNTLPILSHILIEVDPPQLKITATDLDIGITHTQQISALEAGQTTVPAKRFHDIIKELPIEEIKITTKKNNTMLIETQNSVFKILTIPHDEFPKPPHITHKDILTLPQKTLKEMLLKTTFAMSREETRYVLNGVCMEAQNKHLQLIATDGRRLAIIKKPITIDIKEPKTVIIPAKTTQELLKTLKDDGDINIRFAKNQIMFTTTQENIISRLIEGEFPDYKQAIPDKTETKLIVGREQLIAAIKRASLLTTPESQAITLHITTNKVIVTKSTPEVGEVSEALEVKYTGAELRIGFNPVYLLDVLRNIEEEQVCIELTGPEKPGVIRIREEYVYIVLPMQIT